jgi:alkaline phosphatase D
MFLMSFIIVQDKRLLQKIFTPLIALLLFSVELEAATWTDGSQIEIHIAPNEAANWEGVPERRWAGPSIWCNRLQDWRIKDGYLHADAEDNAPCRTAHLLTYGLVEQSDPFTLQVVLRLGEQSGRAGFAGFLIGAGEGKLDYRSAALVHHFPGKGGGLLAVIDTEQGGGVVFRDMSAETNAAEYPRLPDQISHENQQVDYQQDILLSLEGIPLGTGRYNLRLSAWSSMGKELLGAAEIANVDAAKLLGGVALASHCGGLNVVHMFRDFRVGGERLEHYPDRAFGPIAGTLYSVSDNILKLSAQFMHMGEQTFLSVLPKTNDTQYSAGDAQRKRLTAWLEVQNSDGQWKRVDGPKTVAGPDYYVLFRVEGWDADRAAAVRVAFQEFDNTLHYYNTTITRDPVEQSTVSAAGFTGMGAIGRSPYASGPKAQAGEVVIGRWAPANVWMPFAAEVKALQNQNVDLLFFTGDQVYQNKPSPTDLSVEPVEDYLYKWLLWHWSFRDLTDHLPTIVQPDDHDIYHGNLWGWGGRLNLTGNNNDGGYLCSPYFVNMVHRTQSGHLPDPWEPEPALNGISNYYTKFRWGGVGFAVLEDRKFKTPRQVENPDEQVLLGERQKEMLRQWGQDWRGQYFKCVVSQTLYASMHVNFDGELSKDSDSGGFPKIRRDEAVDLFRRCGAIVLSGDQHLGTFSRLGIEQPSDAVYQLVVPALGNYFWRWFYPNEPGENRLPGAPDYTGDFRDGFGNYFRMIAVANPERRTLLQQRLRQRHVFSTEEAARGVGDDIRACLGDGYGILRFQKDTHEITVECWPYNAEPGQKEAQFEGWPVTLKYDELDGRKPVAWLPDLELSNLSGAVVQIIDQQTGEVIVSTRTWEQNFSPGVFQTEGVYTLRVGDPDTDRWWHMDDLKPSIRRGEKQLQIILPR